MHDIVPVMHSAARLERTLVVAAAWHAAALGIVALTVRGGGPRPLVFPRADTAVEVSVEGEAERERAIDPGSVAAAATEAPQGTRDRAAGRATPRARERAPSSPGEPGEPIGAATALDTDSTEGWSFSTTVPGAIPGVESRVAPVVGHGPAEAPPAGAPSRTAAFDSVRRALDAHDRRVGLSAGSVLVDLTRGAVREGRAPVKAHAQIEIRADATGMVTSVHIIQASSAMDAWEDIAKALAAQARARPLRIPPGAGGVAVTLNVDSSLRMPSGHEAGPTTVTVMRQPVTGSGGGGGRTINVGPLGASADIEPTDMLLDATSRPQRVVSVTIAREERL
jgi:hypothetical protein